MFFFLGTDDEPEPPAPETPEMIIHGGEIIYDPVSTETNVDYFNSSIVGGIWGFQFAFSVDYPERILASFRADFQIMKGNYTASIGTNGSSFMNNVSLHRSTGEEITAGILGPGSYYVSGIYDKSEGLSDGSSQAWGIFTPV